MTTARSTAKTTAATTPDYDEIDSRCRLFGRHRVLCARSQDDINLVRHELRSESGKPFCLPLRIFEFDQDVAALDVTEVTQSLAKGL